MHAANVRRSLFLEKHQGLTRTFLLMILFEGKTRNLGGDCWHCFLSLWELVWNCTKDVNFEGKFNSTRFFDYVHLSFSSKAFCMYVCIFSPRVMSDSLRPHGLQHARPPWPSPSPGVCPSSCPLNRWCYPAIASSVTLFSSAFNLSQHQGLFQWVSCLHQWPKYWSFSISPSNEYSGLISFRIDWLDLLAVQRTLKSLLQHHSLKASILWCSAFFMVQLSHAWLLERP